MLAGTRIDKKYGLNALSYIFSLIATPEAKYSRIHTETISVEGLNETVLINFFDALYGNKELQKILEKLPIIYDETINNVE